MTHPAVHVTSFIHFNLQAASFVSSFQPVEKLCRSDLGRTSVVIPAGGFAVQ